MPINETGADVIRERMLLRRYCRYAYPESICLQTVKSDYLPYDGVLTDVGGVPIAVIEAKVRTNRMDAYDSYMLSLEKFQQVCLRGIALSREALLLVGWSCGAVGTYAVTSPRGERMKHWDACHVQVGGRTDRGQESDIEPMIYIPMTLFKIIPEGALEE